jgi:hypothetical protein
MRIVKVEEEEVDLVPGRFRVGISRRMQGFVKPRQLDIGLSAKKSPSN